MHMKTIIKNIFKNAHSIIILSLIYLPLHYSLINNSYGFSFFKRNKATSKDSQFAQFNHPTCQVYYFQNRKDYAEVSLDNDLLQSKGFSVHKYNMNDAFPIGHLYFEITQELEKIKSDKYRCSVTVQLKELSKKLQKNSYMESYKYDDGHGLFNILFFAPNFNNATLEGKDIDKHFFTNVGLSRTIDQWTICDKPLQRALEKLPKCNLQ